MVEVGDAVVDVVLVLVVDVDVFLEELDVELVVEVLEVDVLQVDVELLMMLLCWKILLEQGSLLYWGYFLLMKRWR